MASSKYYSDPKAFNVEAVWTSNESLTVDDWRLAALAQILVELRRLNALLHCPNARDIPHKLERINRALQPARLAKVITAGVEKSKEPF